MAEQQQRKIWLDPTWTSEKAWRVKNTATGICGLICVLRWSSSERSLEKKETGHHKYHFFFFFSLCLAAQAH